jgi:hypothetical protein
VTIDQPNHEPALRDVSDVISGPIGGASLRDPASSGAEGADLDGFPVIDAGADESGATSVVPRRPDDSTPGNEPNAAVRQLEAIIGNLTTFATPVLREIAARAAELAAKAGEAAGPVAHKAAAATEQVGERLAAKGHGIASGLRSERARPVSDESLRSDESTNQDGPPSS